MGRAHSSEKGWTLGGPKVLEWQHRTGKRSVHKLQRGGKTILSASQVAAGSKRHKTVGFGTPYRRPMFSSGRLSVDMMMMMERKTIHKPTDFRIYNMYMGNKSSTLMNVDQSKLKPVNTQIWS
ncbi:jg1628 [Pararge aegeria aegeria]|uniref:Jg1628 protein n=1 Tax=Pararge aegeria aegeria TaxID=348720 RepID=A0A8S4RCX9_9NEOP|nr:jg1628 [Pararge aegeria aegeria]